MGITEAQEKAVSEAADLLINARLWYVITVVPPLKSLPKVGKALVSMETTSNLQPPALREIIYNLSEHSKREEAKEVALNSPPSGAGKPGLKRPH